MSLGIATGAPGVIAGTVIDAYAVMYAALASYIDDGCGLRWSDSRVSRLVAGGIDLERGPMR